MRNRNTPENLRRPSALTFHPSIPSKRMQRNHLQPETKTRAPNSASIRHTSAAPAALEEERVMFSLLFGARPAARSVRQARRRHRHESRKQRSKLAQTAVLFFSCALMTASVWSLRRMQKLEHAMGDASRQFRAAHSHSNQTRMHARNVTDADADLVGGQVAHTRNDSDATRARARARNDAQSPSDETADSPLPHAPTLAAVDAHGGPRAAAGGMDASVGTGSAGGGDGRGSDGGAGAGARAAMERGAVGGMAGVAYGERNWTGADGAGLGLRAAGRVAAGGQMGSAVDASAVVGTGLGGGGRGGVQGHGGEGGDVIDSLDDEEGGHSPVITLARNEMVGETSRESGVVGRHDGLDVGRDATKVGQIQVGLIGRRVGNGTIDREEASGTVSTL